MPYATTTELADYLGVDEADLDRAETINKGHGRRERRSLQTSTRLIRHLDWPGVAQVCRLERGRQRGTRQTVEVVYAITSVPRSQANAARLLAWWRGHWGIENRLHWSRDVVWGEDHCRVRKGHAQRAEQLRPDGSGCGERRVGRHRLDHR